MRAVILRLDGRCGREARFPRAGADLLNSRILSFLGEMKRRKVFRVAGVYVAVGLGILGAAELILEPLGLDSLRPYIVILVLLGFPIALVLA